MARLVLLALAEAPSALSLEEIEACVKAANRSKVRPAVAALADGGIVEEREGRWAISSDVPGALDWSETSGDDAFVRREDRVVSSQRHPLSPAGLPYRRRPSVVPGPEGVDELPQGWSPSRFRWIATYVREQHLPHPLTEGEKTDILVSLKDALRTGGQPLLVSNEFGPPTSPPSPDPDLLSPAPDRASRGGRRRGWRKLVAKIVPRRREHPAGIGRVTAQLKAFYDLLGPPPGWRGPRAGSRMGDDS
jgi:hypothetical protein